MPSNYRTLVEAAAQRHFAVLLEDTRKSNEEAQKVLKDNGLKLVTPNPEDLKELHMYRDMAVEKVLDKAIPRGTYEKMVGHLNDLRSKSK